MLWMIVQIFLLGEPIKRSEDELLDSETRLLDAVAHDLEKVDQTFASLFFNADEEYEAAEPKAHGNDKENMKVDKGQPKDVHPKVFKQMGNGSPNK